MMLNKRSIAITAVVVPMLVLMWQLARAQTPVIGHPAQAEVRQILLALNDSEAEQVMGSYIPGIGAVINIQLVRGPNAIQGKTSYVGTHDWVMYLMPTFGSQLQSVPQNEIISFSVDFFDYNDRLWHHLVMTSPASGIADTSQYQIWLDGEPYADVVARLTTTSVPGTNPALPSTAATLAVPEAAVTSPVAEPAATVDSIPATVPPIAPTLTPGPVNVTLDFADASSVTQNWNQVNGNWVASDGSYAQTELGKFDLISFYNRPVAGPFQLEAEMRYVEGSMGGGIVFAAPTNTSKAGAHMASYTAGGAALHWGYYDEFGIFQAQGYSNVASGADGNVHTVTVETTDTTYRLIVDGAVIAENIPLIQDVDGYVGLTASTSHVIFDNIRMRSSQP